MNLGGKYSLKRVISALLMIAICLSVFAVVGCNQKTESTDVVIYSNNNYPNLNKHSVFMFIDESGNIRPNDPLTVGELTAALNALNNGDGEFSANTDLLVAVSYEQLKAVMNNMFDSSVVSAVFSGSATVRRVDFAVGVCTLLNRGTDEKFKYETLNLPKDINFSTDSLNYLLEASQEHSVSLDGATWAQVDIPTGLNPGFTNIDGYLYYVKDDGCLLKNERKGLLQFGADGRYTTGDKELDATVAGVLKTLIDANPNASRIELLREAFDYSYEEFSYGNRYADDGNHNIYDLGHTGWAVKDAKNMFKLKQGNCYCFAAVFWALARGLGYDARAIAGTCLKDFQPHGWVIIKMDGQDYIFDPEWQWAYINEHKKFDKDMFKIPLNKATWWNYRWDKSQ